MKPIRITRPGTTKFQKMAASQARKRAFLAMVKARGKPKAEGGKP